MCVQFDTLLSAQAYHFIQLQKATVAPISLLCFYQGESNATQFPSLRQHNIFLSRPETSVEPPPRAQSPEPRAQSTVNKIE